MHYKLEKKTRSMNRIALIFFLKSVRSISFKIENTFEYISLVFLKRDVNTDRKLTS